jgi:hypothetical protein
VSNKKEPLHITPADVGKRFRCRDGQIVTITGWRWDEGWPAQSDGTTWQTNGRWWSSGTDSLGDIVERVDEPPHEVDALTRERDEAIAHAAEQARLRGEAEGRLAASEMAGVVDDWRRRAEVAEAAVKRLRAEIAEAREEASAILALIDKPAAASGALGQRFEPCERCEGSGSIALEIDGGWRTVICYRCSGDGNVLKKTESGGE